MRALEKASAQIARQSLEFDSCDIDVKGASAAATCVGRVQYVPEIGNRRLRTEPRRWQFILKKADARWLIASVSSR